MECPGPLPAPASGALPGDVAAALTPLVERISALLTSPEAGPGWLSLALFDSGPGQLGSPRVAQVAAWIALARRGRRSRLRLGSAEGARGGAGFRNDGRRPRPPAGLAHSARSRR